MHIKIGDPLSQFVGTFRYHEKKVGEGSAEVLIDTSYESGYMAKAQYYESIVELNPRVRTNKGFDIPVSFHPEENLSNEEMQSLAMEVANGMGYINVPIVAYRHNDKPHHHFHVVVPSVDYNGKKIQERGNFLKAKKLSEHLEKKYALRNTIRVEKPQQKDYQVEHYSIARAALDYGSLPLQGLNVDEIRDKSNNQIKIDYGKEVYNHLYEFFESEGYQMKSEKQLLSDRLKKHLEESNTLSEYITKLKTEGMYVRKLKSGHYVYKLEKGEFYFSTKKQISTTFSEKGLANYFKQPTITKDPSQEYVARIVKKGLYKGKNLDEFVAFCVERNVFTQFLTYNDGSAYGVNFINAKSGDTYKGSEVNLSYKDLMKNYDRSFTPGQKFKPMNQLKKAASIAKQLNYELNKPDEENRKRE
ncbi:relaxase/mobilization nuclease domain-containing protein [Ekhidna sp. MALMAid0563]|uniref:relaxase/mobilization nuclease domain-containing protein n=1 Tax=Ekhidna sp. MALMAid0563 TaxID=3143937 RepID=UPI0032DFFF4D